MKGHEIRELVNQMRDVAIKYHGAGQLREQIARVVRAYMLQDGTLTNEGTKQAGNSPVIPDGYVMVPKDLLSELRDWAHPEIEKYCEMWGGRRDSEFPALRKVIADADALLAAAPQPQNAPQNIPEIIPGWIPVSERMPEDRTQVILWDAEIGEVTSGHYSHKTHTFYHCGDAIQNEITHWMLPPCAPQEEK